MTTVKRLSRQVQDHCHGRHLWRTAVLAMIFAVGISPGHSYAQQPLSSSVNPADRGSLVGRAGQAAVNGYRAKSEAFRRVDLPLHPRRTDPSQAYQVHPLYQERTPGNLGRPPRRPFNPIRAQGIEPYVRFNYLFGGFSDPSPDTVGALQASPVNPFPGTANNEFTVIFNGAAVTQPLTSPFPAATVGEPVSLENLDFSDLSGFEGVIGIPLTHGAFEVSGIVFDQTGDSDRFQTRFGSFATSITPAIPFSDQGVPQTSLAIPFNTLDLNANVDAWGAGVEYVLPAVSPNRPVTFSPTIGARFFEYNETFTVSGTYNDVASASVFSPTIDSRSSNQIFGPTLGLKTELHGPHVSFSFLPRLGLAVNRNRTQINSSQIFALTQTDSESSRESELAPFLEVDLKATFHLRPNLDMFLGYKAFAFSRIRRAEEQIAYDSIGGAANIRIANDESDLIYHGFMIGGEYTFGRPSTGR